MAVADCNSHFSLSKTLFFDNIKLPEQSLKKQTQRNRHGIHNHRPVTIYLVDGVASSCAISHCVAQAVRMREQWSDGHHQGLRVRR